MKMRRGLLWKSVLIGTVILVALLSAYPLQEKIKLGLDLRGGTYLVLQVETADALRAESDKDLARIVQELQERGAGTASATRT